MKRIIKKVLRIMGLSLLGDLRDMLILQEQKRRRISSKNSFNDYGFQIFSQTDEDGLTLEILARIPEIENNFIEFGVGNGTENNTLVLLASGWKGFWVGGEDIIVPSKNERLNYLQCWVTLDSLESIISLVKSTYSKFGVVSMDLDGNDYWLVQRMLEKSILPDIFIVEYNGKFAPPINFIQDYNDDHTWDRDDYFGASLNSWSNLFDKFGYFLVACNSASGSNAFFVRNEYIDRFSDIPADIGEIYQSPFYLIPSKRSIHKVNSKTIRSLIK